MSNEKKNRSQVSISERALELLRDPAFFQRLQNAVRRRGLVGEKQNATVTYLVGISSVRRRPQNAMLKGPSSAGKNFLATRVLGLFPEEAIREVSSSSATAWNYSEDDFRNKIVYVPERPDGDVGVKPIRLLISEQQLIRAVSINEGGRWVKKDFVATGPISCISTTTRDRVEVDDETRHISLWVDDSPAQTRKIVKGCIPASGSVSNDEPSEDELKVWREVYRIVAERASLPVEFPKWFEIIADNVYVGDIAVRRYFPAFIEGVQTIALLRSFQNQERGYKPTSITASFADYAIAAALFDSVFMDSMGRNDGAELETRRIVEEIATKTNAPVSADQLADYLEISPDKAYARLREALEAGAIVRANKPEKGNAKRYLPASPRRFVPDPKEVLKEIPDLKRPISFVHPLSGKLVTLFGAKRGGKK